ncbi:sporulation protein YunB [Fuchsiella alkaliacetigena]|uniref:sporulation protein YunB n=1 Tax=Fuchsiella alkaliacetigena TaxID=957042 RepID=UPI00200A41CA|nr:sporulation protein YunB [Fuchsiella alkaliacetigena]MCK8825082.1 sporulation protein YunB [Fuchsiella alkaliacetigena]
MNISFKKVIIVALLVIILLTWLTVFLIETKLRPALREISKVKVNNLASMRINQAVHTVSAEFDYNELITIETDEHGNVTYIQPDVNRINDVSSTVTLEIQNYLRKMRHQPVALPVAQIFGIEVLARHSPELVAELIPYASVDTKIIDYFQSAGINQTRHRVDLDVTTRVRVIIPFLSDDIQVHTTVPLTEAVIVGEVPEVYVGLEEGVLSKIE